MKQLDPLGSLRRTHYCGTLRPEHVGQEAVLCGWVHRRRTMGVVFVDLRDRRAWGRWSSSQMRRQAHAKAGELVSNTLSLYAGSSATGEEAINPKHHWRG